MNDLKIVTNDLRTSLNKFKKSANNLNETLDQISSEIKQVEEAIKKSGFPDSFSKHIYAETKKPSEERWPILVNKFLSWQEDRAGVFRLMYTYREWYVTGKDQYHARAAEEFERPFIECSSVIRLENHKHLASFLKGFYKHIQNILAKHEGLEEIEAPLLNEATAE